VWVVNKTNQHFAELIILTGTAHTSLP
jgi:hypothetical protein